MTFRALLVVVCLVGAGCDAPASQGRTIDVEKYRQLCGEDFRCALGHLLVDDMRKMEGSSGTIAIENERADETRIYIDLRITDPVKSAQSDAFAIGQQELIKARPRFCANPGIRRYIEIGGAMQFNILTHDGRRLGSHTYDDC